MAKIQHQRWEVLASCLDEGEWTAEATIDGYLAVGREESGRIVAIRRAGLPAGCDWRAAASDDARVSGFTSQMRTVG
jgi:hypothetical protein